MKRAIPVLAVVSLLAPTPAKHPGFAAPARLATTNGETTLRVTDTATGLGKSYYNPLGNAAAVTDTGALVSCATLEGER